MIDHAFFGFEVFAAIGDGETSYTEGQVFMGPMVNVGSATRAPENPRPEGASSRTATQ
jgi:hypothetical protein